MKYNTGDTKTDKRLHNYRNIVEIISYNMSDKNTTASKMQTYVYNICVSFSLLYSRYEAHTYTMNGCKHTLSLINFKKFKLLKFTALP